jgi:predicted nuclease of predicted toxin-antitoxin system
MRFLIDECLTTALVSVASESGYEALHVAHVGRAGWKDWNVLRFAGEGDFILVTNNASDFRRLYATEPIHAGLVILIPNVDRAEQRRLFRGALDELIRHGDLVNQVLEVDIDGDEVTFTNYELPSSSG